MAYFANPCTSNTTNANRIFKIVTIWAACTVRVLCSFAAAQELRKVLTQTIEVQDAHSFTTFGAQNSFLIFSYECCFLCRYNRFSCKVPLSKSLQKIVFVTVVRDHCVHQKYEFLSRKHAFHSTQRTKLLTMIPVGITVIMLSKSRNYNVISGCL